MMKTREEIKEIVIGVLKQHLYSPEYPEEITENTDIYLELQADSLDGTEIRIRLENRLHCELPEDLVNPDNGSTVKEIIDKIMEHIK